MANVNFNGQSASGGATSLNQLTDVNITSPSDDQVLTYDNGDWINKAVPSPTVPDDLNDLDDVNISIPTDGQIFKYNGTSSEWENANMPTIPDSADDISYDNTTSGLTADDVQEALDEIDGNVDTLSGKVYKTDDSTETTIASDDLLPIYDTSATASKKITVANVVKATVSNPNLLDNPWFTVNQRGQSTYITMGLTEIYTVDRWSMIGWEGKTVSFDVDSSGITFSAGVNAFRQKLYDIWDALVGKKLTISIEYTSTTASGQVGIIKNDSWDTNTIISFKTGHNVDSVTFTAESGTYPSLCIFIPSANTNFNIKAVKLEVGSISTLALDTAPNYATELLKCQRYFQVIPRYSRWRVCGVRPDSFICTINLSTPFRTQPTVSNTMASLRSLDQSSTTLTATSQAVSLNPKDSIALLFTATYASHGLTDGQINLANGDLYLSADL